MAEIRYKPEVIRQQLLTGNTLTGVLPDGTDSGETLQRGAYRTYTGCTLAGLFQLPPSHRGGWRCTRVVWNLPGGGTVTVNLIDENGVAYQLYSAATVTGALDFRDGLLVLPGWAIQVTTSNNVSANGNVIAYLGQGFNQDAFSSAPILGEEALPPSRL